MLHADLPHAPSSATSPAAPTGSPSARQPGSSGSAGRGCSNCVEPTGCPSSSTRAGTTIGASPARGHRQRSGVTVGRWPPRGGQSLAADVAPYRRHCLRLVPLSSKPLLDVLEVETAVLVPDRLGKDAVGDVLSPNPPSYRLISGAAEMIGVADRVPALEQAEAAGGPASPGPGRRGGGW
jgi:hypothetical protein